jgi:hypothetical protein
LPDDARALEATTAVVLAYVLTGDPKVDEMSRAGLLGLSTSCGSAPRSSR